MKPIIISEITYRKMNELKIELFSKRGVQYTFDRLIRESIGLPPDEVDARKRGSKTYFILCDNFIKVGSSDDPKSRLTLLQCGNPYKLHLLKVVEEDIEKEVQEKFYHLRTNGEWFYYDDKLKEFVESI